MADTTAENSTKAIQNAAENETPNELARAEAGAIGDEDAGTAKTSKNYRSKRKRMKLRAIAQREEQARKDAAAAAEAEAALASETNPAADEAQQS